MYQCRVIAVITYQIYYFYFCYTHLLFHSVRVGPKLQLLQSNLQEIARYYTK